MNVIENFAELSFEEQKKFAEALVRTINSESIFTSDTNFTLAGVEADELAGGLYVFLEHDDPIEVSREATWTCSDEDEVNSDPGYDADYADHLFEDTKKAFKTLFATIEGYKVSLEIDDVDMDDTIEVEADKYTHEEDGIGEYEYWGSRGYDSRHYIAVEGTIVKACSCGLSLYVESADEAIAETEVEEV